jgi:tripeptidyl-peptidase-1
VPTRLDFLGRRTFLPVPYNSFSMRPSILFSIALPLQALSKPIQSSHYSVKERHNLPTGWREIGRASGAVIDLRIAVKQGRVQDLERQLFEVSDPDHASYGQHLSRQDVIELTKPVENSLDLVHDWLEKSGISHDQLKYSTARDWIKVTLPLDVVEDLLDTQYQVYERLADGHRVVRTLSWSLPGHLHNHIDTIQPTTSFFRALPQRSWALDLNPTVPQGYTPPSDPNLASVCNISSVTPECFQHLYQTLGYQVQSTGSNNSIGFNNFLGEIPIRPDTVLFTQKYRPDATDAAETFSQISISDGPIQDGPLTSNQSLSGISHEANLDIQAILGISNPIPVVSYSTGGSPPYIPDLQTTSNTNEPYLDWLDYVLGLESVPPVISTSYADDGQTVPKDYAVRVCQELAQLGARGVSLLFASGDSGVGSNGTCVSNDGTNTTQFLPLFPPSCPYVTVVGATHQFQPEVVAYRPPTIRNGTVVSKVYASGGGFGNYFPTPDYQASAVSSYLESLGGQFDGLYNKSGRAYPDVAAQGQYFAYFWNGTEGAISGTSAATPLMSGIIALVNDALIAAGKSPLGFLNPWIYKTGFQGFTDITSGSAVGCETSGFPAVEGWDPVTGYGTPVSVVPECHNGGFH